MHILRVIPLARLPRTIPPVLSYYHSAALPKGTIVAITIGNRHVAGIVIASENIVQQKILIKKMSLGLKRIEGVLFAYPLLTDVQLHLLAWTAQNYALSPATIAQHALRWLPQQPEKLKEFLKKHAPSVISESPALPTALPDAFYGADRIEKHLVPTIQNTLLQKSVLCVLPSHAQAQALSYILQKHFPDLILFTSRTTAWRTNSDLFFKNDSAPHLIITTPSGMFAPWHDVGLVVIEKESWSTTRNRHLHLDVRGTALEMARLYGARAIVSDLYPSLESFFELEQKTLILRTPEIMQSSLLSRTQLIDLRSQAQFEHSFPIASDIERALAEGVLHNKKIILFINRKGYARAALCPLCGTIPMCKNCGSQLAVRKETDKKMILWCKNCSASQPFPDTCPRCHRAPLRFVGLGTQRLETALKEKYPDFPLWRLDRQSAPTAKTAGQIIEDFKESSRGILIATQLLLNFPEALADQVLIMGSDTPLFVPHFQSTQLLCATLTEIEQHSRASVLWQTYQKDHPSLQEFFHVPFSAFAQKELELRKQFHYPPFARLVTLRTEDRGAFRAKQLAERAFSSISQSIQPSRALIYPPRPAVPFFAKKTFSYIIEMKLLDEDPRAKTEALKTLLSSIDRSLYDIQII